MKDNLENTPQTQIATNESLSDLSGELARIKYYCDLCERTYNFKNEETKGKHIVGHYWNFKEDKPKLYKPHLF